MIIYHKYTFFLLFLTFYLSLSVQADHPLIVQVENQVYVAPPEFYDEESGASIAIQGNQLLVGSPRWKLDDSSFRTGKIRWFIQNAEHEWIQQPSIVPNDLNSYDESLFGSSISLLGSRLLVGVPGKNNDAGIVLIYEQGENGEWNVMQEIVGTNTVEDDNFGAAVHQIGNRIVIGAPRNHLAGIDAGAVYIFEEDTLGTWTQTIMFAEGFTSTDNRFGSSVFLFEDYIIAGSPGFMDVDQQLAIGAGYATVFRNFADVDPSWTFRARLTHEYSPNASSNLGQSVALTRTSDNILWAFAGDPAHDNPDICDPGDNENSLNIDNGAVEVYELLEEEEQLQINNTTLIPIDCSWLGHFGFSLDAENGLLLIGCPQTDACHNGEHATDEDGSAYIASYERENKHWYISHEFIPSEQWIDARLGKSVSIDGDQIAIGSPRLEGSGGARIYELMDESFDCNANRVADAIDICLDV